MDRLTTLWAYVTSSPITAMEFVLAAVGIWVGLTWIVMAFDIWALKRDGRW